MQPKFHALLNYDNVSLNRNIYLKKRFDRKLCLTDKNKFLARYTNPTFILIQLFNELHNSKTLYKALNVLDIIQTLLAILNDEVLTLVESNEPNQQTAKKILIDNDYDSEFYRKNSLAYYMSNQKCDWHLTLNRFVNISPSNRSSLDQIVFSTAFRTLTRLLAIQTKLAEVSSSCVKNLESRSKHQNSSILNDLVNNKNGHIEKNDQLNDTLLIDNWLFNTVYSPSSSFLNIMASLLDSYENNASENR